MRKFPLSKASLSLESSIFPQKQLSPKRKTSPQLRIQGSKWWINNNNLRPSPWIDFPFTNFFVFSSPSWRRRENPKQKEILRKNSRREFWKTKSSEIFVRLESQSHSLKRLTRLRFPLVIWWCCGDGGGHVYWWVKVVFRKVSSASGGVLVYHSQGFCCDVFLYVLCFSTIPTHIMHYVINFPIQFPAHAWNDTLIEYPTEKDLRRSFSTSHPDGVGLHHPIASSEKATWKVWTWNGFAPTIDATTLKTASCIIFSYSFCLFIVQFYFSSMSHSI